MVIFVKTVKIMKTSSLMMCALVALTACGTGVKQSVRTPVEMGERIELKTPDPKMGLTINEALAARSSSRDFSPEMLSLEELSGVLWAAAGVNREDGHLTAPSAMALYPIRVYAFLPEGVYRYDSKANVLNRVIEGDRRELTAMQDFAYTAPLNLVYVADYSVYADRNQPVDRIRFWCAADAGGYTENVNLYAAGNGLKAITRGSFKEEALLELPRVMANMAVFFACMQPGDTFMGLDLAHGGHLSHGSPVNMSGKYFNAVGYQLDEATGVIDYDAMERKALECKPKVIVGGASAYSREWDYKRMRAIADKVGALLLVDMAHTAGLIAAGLLDNPVKYAHIVTSTTHKTLRGPRGGIILMGKDFENPWGLTTPKGAVKMMSQILNSAVFPGIQGGPLEHVIAAKAVAFGEALEPSYKEYQAQVQKNARAMAEAFVKRGYKIVSGGTDNHLMLVDLRTKFPELTGKLAEKCLVAADITTNKNMVPFDSRSPFQTSGLRFGTPAITTRGLKEDKMDYIVGLIDRVLHDPENEANIAAVRKDVNALMADYPLFAW